MDSDLRNKLWNALTMSYWDSADKTATWIGENENLEILINRLWHNFYRRPVDTIARYWQTTREEVRKYYFACSWNEVYDFIEFVGENYPDEAKNLRFQELCNSILEKELSAYRFVNKVITQITSKIEISEIEDAINGTQKMQTVKVHLETSLTLLSDRKTPDYRNSIKESISAVEALCNLISGSEKTTLGKVLSIVEDKVPLHAALKQAFEKLYGFTSDSDGIRHALLELPNLAQEDAKFMLITCSAFINYLVTKAAKAKINLS